MAWGRWNGQVGICGGYNYTSASLEKETIYGKEIMDRVRAQIIQCGCQSDPSLCPKKKSFTPAETAGVVVGSVAGVGGVLTAVVVVVSKQRKKHQKVPVPLDESNPQSSFVDGHAILQ